MNFTPKESYEMLTAAECCKASYPQNPNNGLKKLVFNPHTDTETFHYATNHAVYIVFRGTERDSIRDIYTDIMAMHDKCEIPGTEGRVHWGFQRAALSTIQPVISYVEKVHASFRVPLVFTGHSLGGALALYTSIYMMQIGIVSRNTPVYTFGQPKVFNRAFWKSVKKPNRYYRFVNTMDIITWLPVLMAHRGNRIRLSGRWGHNTINYIHNLRTAIT